MTCATALCVCFGVLSLFNLMPAGCAEHCVRKCRTSTGTFSSQLHYAPFALYPHHPPSRSAADLYMQHISTLVAPACSALALAAGADTLWRSLNHALLMLVSQLLFKPPKSVVLTRSSCSLAIRLLSCASERWPASTRWSTACGRRCATPLSPPFFYSFFVLSSLHSPVFRLSRCWFLSAVLGSGGGDCAVLVRG